MRWLLVVALAVGCGGHGGHGAGDDDGAAGDAGAGGDGGTNGGDGGANSGDAGSGSDTTVDTNCARPIAPSVTMTVTGSVPYTGAFNHYNDFGVFRAGDQIIASAVIDPAHYWQRWTGSGWSSEAIPWPANMPTTHNHYIKQVIQLATTRALIVTDDYFLMTYDGHAMSTAVPLPSTGGPHIWAYSQDAAGAYHVFWGVQEFISKPDGTWYPPAPIPIPIQSNLDDVMGAAAIMRDGRVVVMFFDMNFNAPARHAHVLSHAVNGPWSTPVDITPTWAVNAWDAQAYAPPGGGIVLSAGAGTSNADETVLWRSADGTSFGDYEVAPDLAVSGACLDSLVLVGANGGTVDTPGTHALFELQGTSWVPFASDQLPAYSYDVVAVATLPSGKTFWVVSSYQGKTDYLVSP